MAKRRARATPKGKLKPRPPLRRALQNGQVRRAMKGECDVCGKARAGFVFTEGCEEVSSSPGRSYGYCSVECMKKRKNTMRKTENDAALEAGGQAMGGYLEEIGKFNLVDLTKEEWLAALRAMDEARAQHLRDTADHIPF